MKINVNHCVTVNINKILCKIRLTQYYQLRAINKQTKLVKFFTCRSFNKLENIKAKFKI